MKKYFKINDKHTIIIEDTCSNNYYYAVIAKTIFTINIPFTNGCYTLFSKIKYYDMPYYHGMDFKEECNKIYEMYIKELQDKKDKYELLKNL